jgi:hypothetical protein
MVLAHLYVILYCKDIKYALPMKKLSLIVLVFVLTACIPASPGNTNVTSTPLPTDGITTTTPEPGRGLYTSYSEDKVTEATGDIVIFFYAAWCPSCRQMDSTLNAQLNEIPHTLTILKADFDTEIALRQKHGVTIQHTLVQVDSSGNQLKKWNSLYNAYDLQSILDQLQ